MKIKEKFNDLVPIEFGGMQEPLLTNCVDVAKDFAIGFAEWLRDECYDIGNKWLYQQDDETYTSKQLLEIYIKEKGL